MAQRKGREQRDRAGAVSTSEYVASVLDRIASRLAARSERRIGSSGSRRGQRGIQTFSQADGSRQQYWALPVSQRPQLVFGKGDTSQVHSYLPDLRKDSPGAAVALVRFLTMHQFHSDPSMARDQERAGNELSRLLCQICPTTASFANAKARRKEMQSASNTLGRLTAEFYYWEQVYLQYAQGIQSSHKIQELASALWTVCDGLKQAGSDTRQASARIILADVYLQQRDFPRANEQMVQAITIIGTVHKNPVLVELAKTADQALVEQTISSVHAGVASGASSPSARQTAGQPASGQQQTGR